MCIRVQNVVMKRLNNAKLGISLNEGDFSNHKKGHLSDLR
ncbi:hypothetical protein XBFM1_2310001 [Xenorhabdus bovienii str. feltiae Moldova]|uniref:Uncharacterized protein n=1 Tax=Xenorhabdus bovienii str. feltiae Moldova TaxID=1398200 RepID=A0A077NVY4_XENBV|nr:hypothetical protein XBFM1_2310001 [Xenorhabdus bovienii str. feltiae Moldova]